VSVEIQRQVELHFGDVQNKTAYLAFLKQMETLCHDVKRELGADVVRTVYSRKDKQENGEALKAYAKIAKALTAKRIDDPAAPIFEVDDIIGLTVVVLYPDQIELVRARLLEHPGIYVDIMKDEPVVKNGYHAHHIVVRSGDAVHADRRCEVQIKTMMHDAWAAKMHDLNYKPHGYTDRRLATMMGVFGDALQSIEKQSVLLRTLIHERWNAEVRRRLGAQRALFSRLEWIRDAFSPEANAIYQTVRAAANLTTSTPPDWHDIAARVVAHRQSLRERAWLALFLADGSRRPVHAAAALQRVNEFLVIAGEQISRGEVDGQEIWPLPLALSACGDLDGAIAISDYILMHITQLPSEDRDLVHFNLANFLVEQAVFEPVDPDTSSLRSRVEGALAECKYIENEDPSAFHDLRGMLEVALSPDAAVVRDAIKLIERGLNEAKPEYKEIATIYFELHSRLAWRRLLELEAKTADAPPPPNLPKLPPS
jgi:ppGpp synthetase/RelA/SpoT-type nucleotidyltranferase